MIYSSKPLKQILRMFWLFNGPSQKWEKYCSFKLFPTHDLHYHTLYPCNHYKLNQIKRIMNIRIMFHYTIIVWFCVVSLYVSNMKWNNAIFSSSLHTQDLITLQPKLWKRKRIININIILHLYTTFILCMNRSRQENKRILVTFGDSEMKVTKKGFPRVVVCDKKNKRNFFHYCLRQIRGLLSSEKS